MRILMEEYGRAIAACAAIALLFALLFGSLAIWERLADIAEANAGSGDREIPEEEGEILEEAFAREVGVYHLQDILVCGKTYHAEDLLSFTDGECASGIKICSVEKLETGKDCFDVTGEVYQRKKGVFCFLERGSYRLTVSATSPGGAKNCCKVYFGVANRESGEDLGDSEGDCEGDHPGENTGKNGGESAE